MRVQVGLPFFISTNFISRDSGSDCHRHFSAVCCTGKQSLLSGSCNAGYYVLGSELAKRVAADEVVLLRSSSSVIIVRRCGWHSYIPNCGCYQVFVPASSVICQPMFVRRAAAATAAAAGLFIPHVAATRL
jgi:cold shock CspA family protein